MEILYLLIPVALTILLIAIRFLFWAVNNGQYDDLETESKRILFDDPMAAVNGSSEKNQKESD